MPTEHTNVRIALGGTVEFGHLRNLEALDELRPDLRPQAVAENGANAMLPIGGRWFRGQHVAAHFANVLGDLCIRNGIYFTWDAEMGTLSGLKI